MLPDLVVGGSTSTNHKKEVSPQTKYSNRTIEPPQFQKGDSRDLCVFFLLMRCLGFHEPKRVKLESWRLDAVRQSLRYFSQGKQLSLVLPVNAGQILPGLILAREEGYS